MKWEIEEDNENILEWILFHCNFHHSLINGCTLLVVRYAITKLMFIISVVWSMENFETFHALMEI